METNSNPNPQLVDCTLTNWDTRQDPVLYFPLKQVLYGIFTEYDAHVVQM